jgi:hypothetical protein
VEAPVQHTPRRAGRRRGRVLLLHLAEDLRLADHHGVEARRDPEEMADRVPPDVRVEVRAERRLDHAVLAREVRGECRAEGVGARPAGDDLDAVAGRDDGALHHALHGHEPAERVLVVPVLERQPLAQLHRSRAVIQADEDDAALTHAVRTSRGFRSRAR